MSAKPTEPKRAVIYTRVSTGQQEDGTSLAGQAIACHRKAGDIGALVVDLYEETKSGGLYLSRPGIQKSLEQIESGKADMLIVYKLDRSGRVVDDLRDIRRRILRAGGQFIFADGMQFDNTPTGNLMFTQISAFAEYEREVIKERTMKGSRAKASQGYQVSAGKVPYGLRVVLKADVIRGDYPADERGKYYIVEDEAKVVRDIFNWKAQDVSLRAIQSRLSHAGVVSPTGRRLWGLTSLRHLITNPVYKGEATYGRLKTRLDEARVARGLRARYQESSAEDYIIIPAPAIVSAELWQAANKSLNEGREKHSGRKDCRSMLSGLLRCPLCDAKLNRGGHNQARCRYSRPNNIRVCAGCAYYNPPLERATIEAVLYLLENPNALTSARTEHQKQQKQNPPPVSPSRIKTIKTRLAKITHLERIAAQSKVEARVNNASVEVWDALLTEYQSERKTLETEMAKLEAVLNPTPLLPASIEAVQFTPDELADFKAVLCDESKANGATRHELISRIVERVYPVGKGQNSVGARVILKSDGNAEYSITAHKGIFTPQVKPKP